VERERALNFELELECEEGEYGEEEEEEDDGLGFYADGVKRTLTDEQIAVFRRTELWRMKRGQQRRYRGKGEDEYEGLLF
jgi:hypothetical protein